MKKNKKLAPDKKIKVRLTIGIILSIIIIFAIGIIAGYQKTEYSKKPIIKEKIESKDYSYLYNFYFSGVPLIKDRAYFGNKNASITMIAFINIHSEPSSIFFKDIFPTILNEYINTGKVRFYYKYYLSSEDFSNKSELYLYSKALACNEKLGKDQYDFYIHLQNTTVDKLSSLAESNGVSQEEFKLCMDGPTQNEILEDLSEVENLGIMGMNPKFYIGINGKDNTVIDGLPPIATFKRIIKNYQVIIGD